VKELSGTSQPSELHKLRGQLTKTYPNGDDHVYTYDALGRMANHTTPKNEVCTYTYDARDRQTLANWNSTTPDTFWTYWANGLLKSVDNGISKSDYVYNNRDLLTSETQTLSGRPARVVSYDYDADGLRTDLVYPSTRAVEYAWTSRAQLQSVSADGPPPIANYTYDKAGRSTAVIHENGITESKSYDTASQLLANTHLKNGTPVSGHGHTLDDTGRRTNETFADGSTPSRTYGYDTADQVTGADYGNNQEDTYAYDPMGNRTSASIAGQGGGATTYNANNANQYTSITGLTPISHDANGNLRLQNNVTYNWDSENRLLSVTPNTPALGDKSLVHTYDGQHRRVTRTIREWTAGGWTNTETTHFIYDGWNVIEEYQLNTSNSVLVRNLTWGQDLGGSSSLQAAGGVGGLIMVEEINGTTTTAYHFHYDGNGNVTEVTDLSGNSAASYRYDAFGNTLVSTGSYANANRYRFSTKPLDGEVTNAPLYYYGYRYYDPVTGRWPSRDPIEEEGGPNLYNFVTNSAINLIDLVGLKETCVASLDDFGTGGPPSWSKSGAEGGLGWLFFLANKYTYQLAFEIGADSAGAWGIAISQGTFSAWNSFTTSSHDGSSSAFGSVSCDCVEDKCVASAKGGSDNTTDLDWNSAVSVLASASGPSATLTVTAAVAFKGQIAVKNVTAGGEVGKDGSKITGGIEIEMPTTASAQKSSTRTYSYTCKKK
jgi:RHS repeat-associated protein